MNFSRVMHRSFREIGYFALLGIFVVALAAMQPAEEADPADEPATRPNILFLFSDDQRADALGAYGNPYLATPHLDGLARSGFNFRSAYVMGAHHGAVCAPSRAMLMSGRSLYRVYDNLDSVATFPEVFRQNGYVTFGTGKWHQSPASFARSFSEGRNVFFGGMADHMAIPLRDLRPDGSFTEPAQQGFSTTRFAEAAINFIEHHVASDAEAPFLAYVSFTAPHDPRTPPEAYLAQYPAAAMPLPPNFRPVHPFHNGWMTGRDEQLAPWPRTPDVVRAQIGEYYGLITHLDAEVGRILEALRRTGQWENTIIIFASDNGLALGSHGLLGKQSLYEHSTNVPLVITGPGIPAGESGALVYLYDVFPTLARVAGVDPPARVEGQDLSVVWRGEQAAVRETLFTTYEDLQRAVRDERWKLIRYPKLHYTQLFDLQSDPYELRNRADDPAYAHQKERLMGLLEAWQERAGDPHPLTAAEQASMEFDYSTVERVPDEHQPEVIQKKYFNEQKP